MLHVYNTCTSTKTRSWTYIYTELHTYLVYYIYQLESKDMRRNKLSLRQFCKVDLRSCNVNYDTLSSLVPLMIFKIVISLTACCDTPISQFPSSIIVLVIVRLP